MPILLRNRKSKVFVEFGFDEETIARWPIALARLTCDVKTAYGDVKYVSFTYSSFYHSLTVFIRFLVPMKFKQHCANDCLSAMQLTAMLVFLIHVLKLFPSLNKQDFLGLSFPLVYGFLIVYFFALYTATLVHVFFLLFFLVLLICFLTCITYRMIDRQFIVTIAVQIIYILSSFKVVLTQIVTKRR